MPTHHNAKRTVLVTGAAGHIGSSFAHLAADKYRLRLFVREGEAGIERIRPYGEIHPGLLGDVRDLTAACQGMDTVVHLAASPDPSTVWEDLLRDNIIGTYNMFLAAKAAGCRRLIFASSIHAVSGYPGDVQVKTSEPVNPGDLYGVTKCFGEAMGRYMAEQEGLSVVCIRIGAFQPLAVAKRAESLRMLDAYVSPRDLQQLLEKAIEHDEVPFAIVHGISDNAFKRLDISDARALFDYQPHDDFTRLNPVTKAAHFAEVIMDHDLGDANERSGLRDDLARLGKADPKGQKNKK